MNPWRHTAAPPRLFNPVPLPFPAPIPEVQPIRVKATPLCRPPPPPPPPSDFPPPRLSRSHSPSSPAVQTLPLCLYRPPVPNAPSFQGQARLLPHRPLPPCPAAGKRARVTHSARTPSFPLPPPPCCRLARRLRPRSDYATAAPADQAPPNPGEVGMGWEKVRVSSSRSALWRRASFTISLSVIRWSLFLRGLSFPHLQFACAVAFSNTSGVVEKNDST